MSEFVPNPFAQTRTCVEQFCAKYAVFRQRVTAKYPRDTSNCTIRILMIIFDYMISTFFFIARADRRVYGPPNGKWLSSLMDLSDARGRDKPLPTYSKKCKIHIKRHITISSAMYTKK